MNEADPPKLRLLWRNKRLLLGTICVVTVVRLGLLALSYQKVRSILACMVKPNSSPTRLSPRRVGRIVWAVSKVSHLVPGATCLTQAITTQALLARYGEDSRLHLGVARAESGKFEAHAWVEWQSEIIIGWTDRHFTPLTVFNAIGLQQVAGQ